MRQFKSVAIKQYKRHRGLTLIELLIALSIFALIVVGFSNIDTFSRYHVMSSDRRVKLQNDASYILEHMAKEISRAIGDETDPPDSRPVDTSNIGGNPAVQVWIDYNQNGRRDSEPTDRRIAYRYRNSGVDRYQMQFCPECTNPPCTSCSPVWGSAENILSRKITDFTRSYSSSNNYIEIQLTACWDPDGSPVACGSFDNPALSMKNRISMPTVSTH